MLMFAASWTTAFSWKHCISGFCYDHRHHFHSQYWGWC